MEFCINAEELRKALRVIEGAEKNGFNHCLCVFRLVSAGSSIIDCTANFSDLIERAHPTDGRYDWGRFQGVSKLNKFKSGKLIPIR